jgi:dihydrofolate synthase/folylpolyglutamate synthase
MVVIFGCAADKDTTGMLEQIDLGADKVIFTRAAGNARAANPDALARRFTEMRNRMCQVAATLPEAVNLASRAVGRDDLVCITGSFYLVGEAKKYLKDLSHRRE